MQIWFDGLRYVFLSLLWTCQNLHLLPAYKVMPFVFFISVWNHHILCFNPVDYMFSAGAKKRKSHFVITATMPLHGFLIASLQQLRSPLTWQRQKSFSPNYSAIKQAQKCRRRRLRAAVPLPCWRLQLSNCCSTPSAVKKTLEIAAFTALTRAFLTDAPSLQSQSSTWLKPWTNLRLIW